MTWQIRTIEEGWLVVESQVTKRVWSSSRTHQWGTDFWWNAWGLWIQTNWSYHVWLRGSQFSLPTFSMQNFWGPLLPIWINNKDTVDEINTSVLVVIYPASFFFKYFHTHQIGEATYRQATGPCDKLQQSHPLLIIHLLHKLLTHHTVLNTLKSCGTTCFCWSYRELLHINNNILSL